jgi:hypothetical protein
MVSTHRYMFDGNALTNVKRHKCAGAAAGLRASAPDLEPGGFCFQLFSFSVF